MDTLRMIDTLTVDLSEKDIHNLIIDIDHQQMSYEFTIGVVRELIRGLVGELDTTKEMLELSRDLTEIIIEEVKLREH